VTIATRVRRTIWRAGRAMQTLTARLVLTTVALVVLVTVLVAAITTLAVRGYLTNQLDQQVVASVARAQHSPALPDEPEPSGDRRADPGSDAHAGDGLGDLRGQGVGTLTAVWPSPNSAGLGDVIVQGRHGSTSRPRLSASALAAVDRLPVDAAPHEVTLPHFGEYRVAVMAVGDGKVAAGLPTREVSDVVGNLVGWQALLIALGALAAVAGGQALVRRQLRPLRQVAATAHDVARMPLAEGEIHLAQRVPEELTDEHTEVGQVGAALNTLLVHVESSLSARHRSEQQVRQFVADASHELRTPLATILGYSELAQHHPEDVGVLRSAVGKVDEESRRMTSLVEDLLLLARLDSGRPLEQQPVDLTRLLMEAVSDARVLAPDHQWRLDLPQEAVEVVGDERRLHQVATNLLTNARKHTPPGTTVTVAVRPGRFVVHDDGPGFPPELADHAFERFARGDVARNREGGVGLGLALVDAIVTAHGGRVSLHSRPGDTRVDVRLSAA
jgi:two-component system, OmpR family, sensor kinase